MRIDQHAPSVAEDGIDSDHARRFGGIARVYGEAGLARLQQAHVCVVGVGGVGSWAVEALARSAVGAITMIDMDVVAVSNVNRQLQALTNTVGRDKTSVLKERILQINPACQVTEVDEFLNRENLTELLNKGFDYVIDCIDDFRTKSALIHHCKRNGIAVLTMGGAGGQTDPGKIRLTDLSRTQHDVLLAKTRKLLRQDYGFARNPKRSFGIPCVYSDEQLVYPDGHGGLSAQRPAANLEARPEDTQGSASAQGNLGGLTNALNCAGGLGSITHVTASFGFFAAGHVLNSLAK